MAINQYLSTTSLTTEKDLIDSLKQEAIQITGVDMTYILRDQLNPSVIYRESSLSSFTKTAVIEMYFESMTSFSGDADLFSKFGIESSDSAVFQVSNKRFQAETLTLGIDRPREGDLIYVALSNAMFEIKNVIIEDKFYQIGRNYTWRLQCKLFQYGQEKIATNIPSVDAFNNLDSEVISSTVGSTLLETLGLTNFDEESTDLENEINPSIIFDPENPFNE